MSLIGKPDDVLRSLPRNMDAEKAIINCLRMSPALMDKANESLTPEHFYDAGCRAYFKVFRDLFIETGTIDVTMATTRMEKEGQQFFRLLAEICDNDRSSILMFDGYVKMVVEAFNLRTIIEFTDQIRNDAFRGRDSKELIKTIATFSDKAFDSMTLGTTTIPYKEVLSKALALIEERHRNNGAIPGMSFGFDQLDIQTNGVSPGDFIVLTGKSGGGKTALGFQFLRNLASDQPTLFFSPEMTAESIGIRGLSSASSIDGLRLNRGELTIPMFHKMMRDIAGEMDLKLFVDDRADLTLLDIEATTNKYVRMFGVKAILVDYIQLIQDDGKSKNREEEVRKISRGLKALAKRLKIGVIALSQVNDDGKVRDSRAIYHDADKVIHIDYDGNKDAENDDPCARKVTLFLKKIRSGDESPIHMIYEAPFTRFKEANNAKNFKRTIDTPTVKTRGIL